MKKEIYLVLHNIRSAHNVGSIFRTADAAGVSKIYLGGYTPIPETSDKRQGSSKISKTALGAEKYVPWEQYKQTWRLLEKLSAESSKEHSGGFASMSAQQTLGGKKVQIVALEQSPGAIDYRKFSQSLRNGVSKSRNPVSLALILGNEVGGLSKEILKYADKIIAIPMYGQKESLNVSVAAGIALFKIIEK